MHEGEFAIGQALVRRLVDGQFPQWRDRSLTRVPSSGTVHAMYRLGDDLAVRLPRLAEFGPALERELDLLARVAPFLPLRIPTVAARGEPTAAYPASWSVLQWIEGEPLSSHPVADPIDTATHLGEFVVAMRSINLPGESSPNQRGRALATADDWTRSSIAAVANEFDAERLTYLWEAALAAQPWDGVPTWIHGDLLPGNLLVADGRLCAVIDFGEASIGNPTWDLVAAWWVFSAEGRDTFLDAAMAGDAARDRARGWALSGGVGALAYYVDSNRAFADLARRTIRNVMAD